MDVNAFDYTLPEELIAQSPAAERTASRLMAVDRRTGRWEHRPFTSFIDYLHPGDTLVLNDTKVMPARLFGVRRHTGAKVELLLLHHLGDDRWEALVRPAKKLRAGDWIDFGQANRLLSAQVEEEKEAGGRIIRFHYEGIWSELLDQLGHMPLPPYIRQQLMEKSRYQTVYAKHEGSAAAPTAGLHFSASYLEQIKEKGIAITYVTLHVGLGTFRPVSVERVEDHVMHAEYYELSAAAAQEINATRKRGGRIIAVGTTSARTLEAVAQMQGNECLEAACGWTDIFIFPGYEFKCVDALLTNFHLPKSTLLMLVSALSSRELVLRAYEEAVAQRYRFFSFGDAMFLY